MKQFTSSALMIAVLMAGIFFIYGCGSDGGGAPAADPAADPAPDPAPVSPPVVVVFVSAAALGAADGSSFSDAFTTLQAGVDAALSGEEVWVRQGTYRAASANAPVLTMKDGVELYGGFTGTETARGERSTDAALTILSGDFDISGTFSATDSYHVVVGVSNARLDGFTVTAGNSAAASPNDSGGGMFNDNASSPVLSNVTFVSNTAANLGGGMFNDNASSPVLSNVTFVSNTAGTGGGMLNFRFSNPVLSNVTFSANSAGTGGGGMFNTAFSSPVLNNVAFSANSANNGGGMYNNASSRPVLSNVTFSANSAANLGGGMVNLFSSNPVLSNVTFSANSAGTNGGGMANFSASSPVLSNVAFWGNTGAGPDVFNSSSTPVIAYTCAEQDLSAFSATNILLGASPFEIAASGEVFLNQASPCVDAGLDIIADDPITGFTALGLPHWSQMTTSLTGAPLDTDGAGFFDVDAGRHYDPAEAWVAVIFASPGALSWGNHGATACEITNSADATVLTVDAASLVTGGVVHGQATGTILTLTCQGASGLPAVAQATVP